MKELYGEGPASHTDPESCVVSRKAGHEALTGAHAGGALSREISGNQDAGAVYSAGRQHWWARHREHPLDLRGQRPPICMGKRFRLQASGTPPPWHTVVRIVGDIHQGGLDTAPVHEYYTSFTQGYAP